MKRVLLVSITLIISVGALVSWYIATDMRQQLQQPLNLASPTILHIKPGTSLTMISNELVANEWLDHPYYLIFEGRRRGISISIKAGEYKLTPGLTLEAFLQMIVEGKVIQYSLTIPEGWTFNQIMSAVTNNKQLKQTLPDITHETVMGRLGFPGELPEGRFFPDTYYFPTGTTDVEFLSRAYRTMEQILTSEWQQRLPDLPYKSPYEALIMASIIEKETAVPDERRKIAGVFVRRLQKGIKLQTDPTVIYAIGATYDGNIRRKDLFIDSPFNTYKNSGLPPTPIAAPGRASIRAALQPEEGNALYFVATGDGKHHFSDTLEEHNQAVAKYQLNK